ESCLPMRSPHASETIDRFLTSSASSPHRCYLSSSNTTQCKSLFHCLLLSSTWAPPPNPCCLRSRAWYFTPAQNCLRNTSSFSIERNLVKWIIAPHRSDRKVPVLLKRSFAAICIIAKFDGEVS